MNNLIFFPQGYKQGVVQDYISNAIFYWKHTPEFSITTLFILFSLILASGLFLYFKKMSGSILALSYSVAVPFTITLLFGVDLVIMQLLAFLPWYLYLAQNLEGSKSKFYFASVIVLTCLSYYFCNHLLILPVFLLLCVLDPFKHNNQKAIISIIFAILICLSLNNFKFYQIPDLPTGFEYVPNQYSLKTLAADRLNEPVIDLQLYLGNFRKLAAVVTFLSLVLLAIYRRKNYVILASSSLLLFLEYIVKYPDYLPFTALTKLLPGLFNVHFFTILLAFLCFGTLILSGKRIFITLLILIPFSQVSSNAREISLGFLEKSNISPNNLANVYNDTLPKQITWVQPSIKAVKFNGKDSSFVELLDNNPETRLTSNYGHQTGNETLEIFFNDISVIKGIDLDLGNFISDYPRGIQILYSPDCNSEQLMEIVNHKFWWGGYKELNNQLYFGEFSNMKIVFPYEINVCKILVKQTYPGTSYDWSVAEFKVAN